jgi:tryptophanase
VFTLSQTKFVIDRVKWLYDNRELVGGLEWIEEPRLLRFFMGRLKAKTDWPEKLVAKFKADFGESL